MLEEALLALARETVFENDGSAPFGEVVEAVMAEVDMPGWQDSTARDRVGELLSDAVFSERGALRLLVDDQLVDVPTLTEGRALTHVLTHDEIATDRLALDPDLGLLAALADIDGGLHLPDGTPLRLRTRRERGAGREGTTRITQTLAGPAAWLRGHQPGDLVVARCRDGFLELAAITEAELAPPPAGLAQLLHELFDRVNEGDGSPIDFGSLVLAAAAVGSDLFLQPTRPLGELVVEAGFEIDGDKMGRPGSWARSAEVHDAVGLIIRSQHLEESESRLVSEAVKAVREAAAAGTGIPRLLAGRLVRDWPVCFVVFDELRRGSRPLDAAGLAQVGAATGGPFGLWLQGRAAAIDGRTAESVELAQAAFEADPAFGPAVNDVAQLASDQGRARDAANLLHRVRHGDDPQVERLRQLAAAQQPAVGRNDPCGCGSGRKFKHCHAGRDLLPDKSRVTWLLVKANAYLRLAAPPDLLHDFGDGEGGGPAHSLIGSDILLFEDGWMARFLEARGALLPDPEAEWVARWLAESRLVLGRVEAADDSGRLVLEELPSGQRVEVHGVPLDPSTLLDRLLLCRVLPVGDRLFCSTGVRPAWLSERDGLLAALGEPHSPEEWRDLWMPESHPPTLITTSGEPMMQCHLSALIDADAVDSIAAALTARFGEPDAAGSGLEWRSKADTDTLDDVITATYFLLGSRLRVNTSSLARLEAARGILDEVAPGYTVEYQEREPMARVRARLADEQVVSSLLALSARLGSGLDDEFGDEFDDEFGDDDEFALEMLRRLGDDHDVDVDDVDDVDAGLADASRGELRGLLDDDGDGHDADRLSDGFDPDLDAQLVEHMRAQDERWVDTPIPALGGSTPRQAAADPSLVGDLRTLLAEMEGRSRTPVDDLRKRLGLID